MQEENIFFVFFCFESFKVERVQLHNWMVFINLFLRYGKKEWTQVCRFS